MMKKLSVLFLIITVFLFCGFKRKVKPIIILSSNYITLETAKRIENSFFAKSRIFYALYSPDGFKNQGIRLQISKQEDKVSNWGFSIIMTRDIYINSGEKIYKDNLHISQPGHYIIQFFYLNNKDYPFAHREFKVY